MVHTDANGIPQKTADGRPLVTAQNKWCFHYSRFCFSSATHMVLFEDASESSIPLDKFAQEGRIFANGGNLSFERITDWIQRGKATVLLSNTGGVAHSFGSLHTWCVTKKHLLEGVEKDPAKRRSLILDKVLLCLSRKTRNVRKQVYSSGRYIMIHVNVFIQKIKR